MTNLRAAVLCLGLVLFGGWVPGCDEGSGGDPDPGCVANSRIICERACECNGTGECSQEYPSGSSQTFNSESHCLNAWRNYCIDLPEGLLDATQCEADLAAAQCVDSGDRQAIDLPSTCYVYLSTQECMDYGERICNLACACDATELCPVGHTATLRITYTDWGSCFSNMTGACDVELTGITDYAPCMQDLDAAQCIDIGDNQGLELPGTCWQS